MQEKQRKLVMLISLVVGVVVSICAILFAMTKSSVLFDIAFWALICYVVASIAIWLFYGILSLRKKPKKAIIFAGIAIAVIVVSVVLGFVDKAMSVDFLLRYQTSEMASKLIAIACYITYISVFGALVLMIYSAITKALKK